MANPLKNVKSWLYHLGAVNAAEAKAIAATGADLVVVDAENGNMVPYTRAEVAAMRADSDTLVVSYLSIGEAEDYRNYWSSTWSSKPPSWLAAANPEWPDNYKVKYWDPSWQSIMFKKVDQIVASGFNGVYLDIVDAYQFWQDEAPNGGVNYAKAMVDFIAQLKARGEAAMAARGMTGEFVVIGQNAEELVADDPRYVSIVDGIAKEDLRFIYENGREGAFKPVPDGWYNGSVELLQKAAAAGVEIFVVEYMTAARQTQYASTLTEEKADLLKLGAPLYLAAERDLLKVYTMVPDTTASSAPPPSADKMTYGGAGTDALLGGTGDDQLFGRDGNDTLRGEAGRDSLYGESGNDSLLGGADNDRLGGGAGLDVLRGGAGSDRLAGAVGNDTLFGDDGDDTISGNAGDDTLYGGGGNDLLRGNAGTNTLWGGAGRDSFIFEAACTGTSTVRDFEKGVDRLVFPGEVDVVAATNTAAGARLALDTGGFVIVAGMLVSDLGLL